MKTVYLISFRVHKRVSYNGFSHRHTMLLDPIVVENCSVEQGSPEMDRLVAIAECAALDRPDVFEWGPHRISVEQITKTEMI